MKGLWLNHMRGYVRLKLVGGDPEAFLNGAILQRIPLWDIAYNREGALTCRVSVPDFFLLRPLLRQAGARSRLLERKGFPFQMARLSRRKTFAGGLLAFAATLFILSMLIWEVEVKTDDTVPKSLVMQAAKEEGIRPFQWSFRLQDTTELAHNIARRLPEAAWVGVQKSGTRVTVSVVKNNKPEERKTIGPSDLIAKTDAVITRIVAESGRPKVQSNSRVRKGDVLISGTLGEGDRTKIVESKGEIRGLVWHEYEIASPLKRQISTFTGDSVSRRYLVLGNRALQTSGYKNRKFDQSQVRTDWERFSLGKWTLPIGWLREKELEVYNVTDTLTTQQARQAGLDAAHAQIIAAAGKDAVIKAEKILHEQTENGKVMLHVLIEVEQSIAVERPIVTLSDSQGE